MSDQPKSKDAVDPEDPDVYVTIRIRLHPAMSMAEIRQLAALAASEGQTLSGFTADALRKRAETAAA